MKLRKSAEKELAKLDKQAALRVAAKIYGLAEDPFPAASRQLIGSSRWRLRVGDYRIIYEVGQAELVIWVIKIGHRKDVYER